VGQLAAAGQRVGVVGPEDPLALLQAPAVRVNRLAGLPGRVVRGR